MSSTQILVVHGDTRGRGVPGTAATAAGPLHMGTALGLD